MTRPCFLVIDREFSGSISTRKLVIETAKFNVITAYSSQEAIETVRRFPALDGVVVDAGMTDLPCTELAAELKRIKPDLPLIAVGAPYTDHCGGVDHHLDSFNPAKLLELLQGLKPEQTKEIEKRNEDLSRKDVEH